MGLNPQHDELFHMDSLVQDCSISSALAVLHKAIDIRSKGLRDCFAVKWHQMQDEFCP